MRRRQTGRHAGATAGASTIPQHSRQPYLARDPRTCGALVRPTCSSSSGLRSGCWEAKWSTTALQVSMYRRQAGRGA